MNPEHEDAVERMDFNAEHPRRPGVTVGEDLADQNTMLAFKLLAAEQRASEWDAAMYERDLAHRKKATAEDALSRAELERDDYKSTLLAAQQRAEDAEREKRDLVIELDLMTKDRDAVLADIDLARAEKAESERDQWIRAFNRLEKAVTSHKNATSDFQTEHDEALYAAHGSIMRTLCGRD